MPELTAACMHTAEPTVHFVDHYKIWLELILIKVLLDLVT